MARDIVQRAPAGLSELLTSLDPREDGSGIVIAADLLAPFSWIDDAALAACGHFIDQELADPNVTRAELKRLLKKMAGAGWGTPFDEGDDERRFLKAVREAIRLKLQ